MRRILVSLTLIASVVASSSAFAAMDKATHEKFVDKCVKQMLYTKPQCGCMGDIAGKKLDDLSIAYLNLFNQPAIASAMSKKMTGKQLSSINNFMATAPHQCKSAK